MTAIIPLLDPAPTKTDCQIRHDVCNQNSFVRYLTVEEIAALRVRIARETIEWAVMRVDCTPGENGRPSAHDVLLWALHEHDAAIKEREKP